MLTSRKIQKNRLSRGIVSLLSNLQLCAVVILVGISFQSAQGQNFKFLVEGGFMISQMDGDGLNGFDKLGPKLSIGVVYPLTQQFELAAAGTFYRHGSDRGSFKISPNNTREDVLEMDIQSVGLSLVFQWRPPTSRKMIGIGPVFHKIFNSNPTVLEFRGLDPPRVFAEDTFRNYFFAVKAFAGHEFSEQFRFIFTVELAVSNILTLPIDGITKISPYSFSFTFAYEINPSGKKIKSSTRKKRS